MYLNGVMVASKPCKRHRALDHRKCADRTPNQHRTPSQNFHFAGREDEISIFNRALSASEIQSIYDAGRAGKFWTPTGPLYLDTDQDGIPDFWEITFGHRSVMPSNNHDSQRRRLHRPGRILQLARRAARAHGHQHARRRGLDAAVRQDGQLELLRDQQHPRLVYLTNVLITPITWAP